MKTPVDKLLWKEFGIKNSEVLSEKLDTVPEDSFPQLFSITKSEFIKKCRILIKQIDVDGDTIINARDMVEDGSMIQSWAKGPYYLIMNRYKANRKALIIMLRQILAQDRIG
jgi:hypothetical protein